MGTFSATCSHCGSLNILTGGPVYCVSCGHRGDVARLDCTCAKCSRPFRGMTPEQSAVLMTAFQRPRPN